MAAPLQGYTDAAWRQAHARIYGGVGCYYTPFARVEKGCVRAKDVRETALTDSYTLVPQIIFRDITEFDILVSALAAAGHKRIDLNLGCPFPPQVHHGRGAGALVRRDLMQKVATRRNELPDMKFSIKMRLGIDSPGQWRESADIIAAMPLTHVTIHPRIARQQYSGELHTGEFAEAAAALPHPVVFNGDILTPADIDRLLAMPHVEGVMAGRGLLARPSLAVEWLNGRQWTRDERVSAILSLHAEVLEARAGRLCGDTQILSAMRPFWDYLEAEIGHKCAKAIRKAGNMAKYTSAVASIG